MARKPRVSPHEADSDNLINHRRFSYTPKEVAALTGVSIKNVHRHLRLGTLRSVRPTGPNGGHIIPHKWILEWLGVTNEDIGLSKD